MTKKISIAITFLVGLGMIFLGARFLISPESAELGYGIRFNEQGDYSFHHIKGIRDLFSGLLICALVLTAQTKALGISLLIATIIPFTDLLIVLSKDYTGITQTIPHFAAIMVCSLCGLVLLFNRKSRNTDRVGCNK